MFENIKKNLRFGGNQINNLDVIKKSIFYHVIAVLFFICISLAIITLLMQRYINEKNNQIERHQINTAIVNFQNSLSKNLSILASMPVFINYLHSGVKTREEMYPDFLSEISSIKLPGVVGMEIGKKGLAPFFDYGIKTPFHAKFKACYLNQKLEPNMGSCDYLINLFFSKTAIKNIITLNNPNVSACETCQTYSLFPNQNFGDFFVDEHASLKIGLSSKQAGQNIFYVYYIFFFSLILFAFWSWKKFKNEINKYIDFPIKYIASSLKKNERITLADHDIEEIKYLGEQIENWRLQSEEFQKNLHEAKIGKISAQVAHDIRSPLAALNAIVKQTQNIPEKQRIMIRNATKQINDIANNLLVQYRTEKTGEPAADQNNTSPEMISILLDTVVSEKRAQEHAILVNIEFVVDPDSHGVFAKVNPADFKRVISNLINNGIEALKSGGNITLNLSHTEKFIKIELTDSGSGMPQELIHQIMAGAAVTRKKEGHGIGLASSRQYIQSWGGDLTISSEINVGTTIHITLPLIPAADWFADKLEFTQNSPVIILDDDQSIHDVWQSRIDTEIPNTNLTLNHFYQPQDLLNSPIKVDKYLCDYELLGHALSGLDVIEQLELSNKATLVTSRYEDPVIQERCRKIGVKILPKNYAAYVPLVITAIANEVKQAPETKLELAAKPKPDLILIDDNQTLTDAWKFTAEFENKNIVVFNSLKEVDDNIHQYSVESKIYIDSDLGEAIRGEDYAKMLYEKGFYDIYLATGYDSSKFDLAKFYWIKSIVSKEPMFD